MNRAKDCIGKKFGRLTVLEIDHKTESGQNYVLCRCDCGTEKVIKWGSVSTGLIVSCGCRQREVQKYGSIKHGKTNTRLFSIWQNMKKRCYYSKYVEFKNYGARGITVCEEWKNSFETFYNWAMTNGYSDDLSIDRINNNGNYEPSNCRWADRKQQSRNRSINHYLTYKGETKTLIEWAEEKDIEYKKLWARVKSKMAEDRIFE